jgi:hypothetical protein
MLDIMIYDCNIFNLALHFKCGYSGISGLGFGYWGIRIFGISLLSISLISKLPNLKNPDYPITRYPLYKLT